ncbi:MAG: hypothetical protein H0V66_04975 [Bdellovibrionales bacterium]|nr:hypothetical protein [Bdellovibrionales bacterium]
MKSLIINLLTLSLVLSGCEVSYKKSHIEGANVVTLGIFLNAKVCLEGAYSSDSPLTMTTNLNSLNLLPISTPYLSSAPWYHLSSHDQVLSPDVLALGFFVDWVVVEVFQYEGGSYVLKDSQSALLKSDGTLYDTLGYPGLSFPSLLAGNYYINILSRNHLSVASANPVSLSGSFDETIYNIDFTSQLTSYLDEGTLAPHTLPATTTGTAKCLLAGDTNGDLMIRSSLVLGAPVPDGYKLRQDLDNAIASSFPDNISIVCYFSTDTNLNGEIQQYNDHPGTIPETDFNFILINDGKDGSTY